MENRYETFTGLVLNISRCIDKIKNIETLGGVITKKLPELSDEQEEELPADEV